MGHQKSQQTSRNASSSEHTRRPTGTLFVVGTPIGCPDDLTLRARTILTRVSIVAAETPLVTRTLLDCHGIGQPSRDTAKATKKKLSSFSTGSLQATTSPSCRTAVCRSSMIQADG